MRIQQECGMRGEESRIERGEGLRRIENESKH